MMDAALQRTLRKGRALVVDDEPFIVEVIGEAMRDAGFEVQTAASGEEALDMLAAQEYDVALLDVRMPGLSGLDVLLQLSNAHPDTAVIMVTAESEAQVAVGTMKMGADDYIVKPFNLTDLTNKVMNARKKRVSKMKEKDRLRRLEETLMEERERSNQLFKDTVQGLAREHALVYAAASGKGRQPNTLDGLPQELRTPARSTEEFADALCRVIRRGQKAASKPSR